MVEAAGARKLILFSGLVLAIVVVSPAAAMGAAKGTNRDLTGTVTLTTTVNLITLAGTQVASGQLSHLGKVTDSGDLQFAPPRPACGGAPPLREGSRMRLSPRYATRREVRQLLSEAQIERSSRKRSIGAELLSARMR